MTSIFSPPELAVIFTGIGDQLAGCGSRVEALAMLTRLAVERVPGAKHAGITSGRLGEAFETIAPTDEVVGTVDRIQYALGSGPCVDAVITDTTFNAGDLRTDERWPRFGERAYETAGIVSMLALRLYLESDLDMIAALNIYSEQPGAFDDASEVIAVLLAVHGSLAVGRAAAREKAQNLLIALQSSREIGVAIGIVMARTKVTRDQGFDLLRILSQSTHRKLAELATEIADTGVVPDIPSFR